MNNKELADILFPDVSESVENLEKRFPDRGLPKGAIVTRLGPSPTGFIHLGNLYGAFVDERLAHQSGGTFYLRIEDTDDKRYVEGAVENIIKSLAFFNIGFDEGATAKGERGEYGPYTQSQRKDIYRAVAKRLVANGDAYPCFLSEEEIEDIRKNQETGKLTPGIYGDFSPWRNKSVENVKAAIADGDPYVLRLRSDGSEDGERIAIEDGVRGRIEMPENFQDIVLLKTTGIPTYHFAHVVDDHLMRTTHVVRGEEWLSSLPVHYELFRKMGWEMPIYCHTAQLMKLDENGKKRKLSKRNDPELSLEYYRNEGYHPDAVREYLITVLNSNFEEWRAQNNNSAIDEFVFSMEKMSSSGTLFDLDKLRDISKTVLLNKSVGNLYDFLKDWCENYMPYKSFMFEDRQYMEKILDIGRHDRKPRKDLIYAKQIVEFISYFFDETFVIEDEKPAEVPNADVTAILEAYELSYDHDDDQSEWFSKIRAVSVEMGYAAKPKDYKKNPNYYKGHVGHVSAVIRLAITGRSQSPDVWAIQQILGKDRTLARVAAYKNRTVW